MRYAEAFQLSLGSDKGGEVEETVCGVDGNDAVRAEMTAINGKTFTGQKVDRDGVTTEGIHHQNVKILLPVRCELRFQHKPSVAGDRLDPCGGIGKVGKLFTGNGDYRWIDLIETEDITGKSVYCYRAGSETDNANP